MKGLGEKERQVVASLAALERPVVTADDVVSELSLSRGAANLVLSRLARKGWLRRLRRGMYTVVPLSSRSDRVPIEDPLGVAMTLFDPCYISGWTAAEHWDLTEQVHNALVVYSAAPQRHSTQHVGGVAYHVRRINVDAIFGTTRLWSGTVAVEMADIHRTVIDILDAPEMGGGGRQMIDIVRAYWSRREADPRILLEMAQRLGRGTVFKRLGFTMEKFGRVEERWLSACREHLSAGVSLLDPAGPARGPIITRWRLRINVPLGDVS
jgi:predicted transcriptional regulator of viral defense system